MLWLWFLCCRVPRGELWPRLWVQLSVPERSCLRPRQRSLHLHGGLDRNLLWKRYCCSPGPSRIHGEFVLVFVQRAGFTIDSIGSKGTTELLLEADIEMWAPLLAQQSIVLDAKCWARVFTWLKLDICLRLLLYHIFMKTLFKQSPTIWTLSREKLVQPYACLFPVPPWSDFEKNMDVCIIPVKLFKNRFTSN